VNYQIDGLENIPKDRVAVILSKHQSTWETFYLPTLFNQAAIILKKELLWVPFFGWGLGITDPIAINRNDPKSAMDQIIQQGKKCLDTGRFILVFPEGTRIPPGKVGKYRLGGARLATATGYPVIPVAHNAGKHWKKRGFYKIPGTIQVIIGPLIETKDRTAEEVLNQAKNWIEDKMKNL
jgi:1-acyl-sn-glycerol-3-phosphate acyltransferase